MPNNTYTFTSINGGTGSLKNKDGGDLADKDGAYVGGDGYGRFWELDEDSAAAESLPTIVAPTTNAGNKRWILKRVEHEIDALTDYGMGVNFTQATIEAALTAIGVTDKTTLLLRPGTWVINSDADWSAYSNVTFKIAPGAILSGAFTVTFGSQPSISWGEYPVFVSSLTVSGLQWATPQMFGGISDSGTTDNKAAIKAAVASLIIGGKLIIPQRTGYYKYNNDGGLTDATVIDKKLSVYVYGTIKGTSSTAGLNPPFIFNVTAADVTFKGDGTLQGPGTYVVDEADFAHRPGLIRVAANNFTLSEITLADPPETAITVSSADNALITHAKFTGGPLVADATSPQHFYIDMYNSDRPKIIDNRFYADSTAGATRNAINGSSCAGVVVVDNDFYNMHEHAVYVYTTSGTCSNNTIRYTQAVANQLGSAIVFAGDKNIISLNTIRNALLGGIALREASGCLVIGNNLYGVGYVGISIQNTTAIAEGLNYNSIIGNQLFAASSGTIYSGIRYISDTGCTAVSVGGNIKSNTLVGWGDVSAVNLAAIEVSGVSGTYPMKSFDISGNEITGSLGQGIYLDNVNNSQIKKNYLYNNTRADFRAIYLGTVTSLVVESNIADDYQDTPTMSYFLYNGVAATDIWLQNNECYGATETNPFGFSVASNIRGISNRASRTQLLPSAPRLALLTIGGLTDATQVNATFTNLLGSETLAIETVDKDTPTGGTRFDISAAGTVLTIKGLTTTALAGIGTLEFTDTTAFYSVYVTVATGKITVTLYDASGSAVDLCGLANGKTIYIKLQYWTLE